MLHFFCSWLSVLILLPIYIGKSAFGIDACPICQLKLLIVSSTEALGRQYLDCIFACHHLLALALILAYPVSMFHCSWWSL
jgi:hypothetical protein